MAINVFAGARRIALLISAVAALGTLIALWASPPYVGIKVQVTHPQAPFALTEDECPWDSARHYFTTKLRGERSIGVDLCMKSMDFHGAQLIPYRVDAAGMIYGAASYSDEVDAYEKELKKRFQLSPADLKAVDKITSQRDTRAWKDGLFYLSIALGVFWAAVWGIGWIVRGFTGIPMGKDHRPTDNRSR